MPAPLRIRETAIDILEQHPVGLRYNQLHEHLCAALPEFSPNTIHSGLLTFKHSLPDEVKLVRKAQYLHAKYVNGGG